MSPYSERDKRSRSDGRRTDSHACCDRVHGRARLRSRVIVAMLIAEAEAELACAQDYAGATLAAQ